MTSDTNATTGWKKCSSCKQWIDFETLYWVCNVSTCNRKRTGLVFCTVSCWETHVPLMNHRESWAEERHSPSRAKWAAEQREEASKDAPRRRIVRAESQVSGTAAPASHAPGLAADPSLSDDVPKEILIVASRLKAYVAARSGMNTSERVLSHLSDIVRRVCDEAIRNAARDERKTVLDRDVPKK